MYFVLQAICRKGGEWFASFGRDRNRGTKVSGDIVSGKRRTSICVCSHKDDVI